MVSISTSGNAETAAFAVLLQKGFSVQSSALLGEPLLVAEKDEQEYRGQSALEILGLISVIEARGENWHPVDPEVDQLVQFLDEFYKNTTAGD